LEADKIELPFNLQNYKDVINMIYVGIYLVLTALILAFNHGAHMNG